jgi:hypothetical protein
MTAQEAVGVLASKHRTMLLGGLAIVPQPCSSSIFERCWSTGVGLRKGTSKRREVPWRLLQGLIGGEKVDFILN